MGFSKLGTGGRSLRTSKSILETLSFNFASKASIKILDKCSTKAQGLLEATSSIKEVIST